MADPDRAALARGFYHPRPAHLGEDLRRSREVLLGEDGGEALSAGEAGHPRWRTPPPPDVWQHLRLPEPVLHPAAMLAWGARLGFGPAAVEALVGGACFVDAQGALRLWPWYREEDAEERPRALERAAALGAALPERFLDEPFEAAWYLRRTGPEALLRLARERGLGDPAEAQVEIVPVLPPAERHALRLEGGRRVAAPFTQRLQLVMQIAAHFEHIPEDSPYRPLARERLQRALHLLVIAAGGEVSAPEPRTATLTLRGGPPPAQEDEDGGAASLEELATIEGVWALDEGALLVFHARLVWLGPDGQVRGQRPFAGTVEHAAGRCALVQHRGDWYALDVVSGQWLSGDFDPSQWFGGPLSQAPDTMPLGQEHADESFPQIVRTPDARHAWRPEDGEGVIRLEDGIVVADTDAFGDVDDEEEPPAEDEGDGDEDEEQDDDPRKRDQEALPELIAPGSLPAPGASTFRIDGVTFTLRAGGPAVRDAGPMAIALGPRGFFRAFVWRALREDGRRVARLGVPCHHASFSRGGRLLWALGPDHLHCITWDDQPRHAHSIPLAPLAALFRAAEEDAT